ncbi:hypothetical protein CQA09_28470, partial [Klebsiella pneumoniae]
LSGDGEFTTKAGGMGWLNLEDEEGFFKALTDRDGELIGVKDTPVESLDLTAADAQNKAYSLSGDGEFTTKAGGMGWLNLEDEEGFFKALTDR